MNKSPHVSAATNHICTFTMNDLANDTDHPTAPDAEKPGGRGGKRT